MSEKQPDRALVFACAILRKGSEYLIIRPASQEGRAKWAFPATVVAEGESPEAACRRICSDGLGAGVVIDFGQPPLQAKQGEQTVSYRYFFAHVEMGEVRALGFEEARWVQLGQLSEYEYDPTTQMVIDWLLEKQ